MSATGVVSKTLKKETKTSKPEKRYFHNIQRAEPSSLFS